MRPRVLVINEMKFTMVSLIACRSGDSDGKKYQTSLCFDAAARAGQRQADGRQMNRIPLLDDSNPAPSVV